MTIRASPNGRVTILHVAGEVDLVTSGELREQIALWSFASGEVALDLTDVGFIDAAGVHALVDAFDAGYPFRVWKLSRPVERILGLLHQQHLVS